MMPEKQLFSYAEYKAQEAERIGYSEYSYWKSVWRNFLKKKAAVIMLGVFALLFIFTFIAGAIGKYDVHNLRIVDDLMFTAPNGEFWFGTDNMGRDYWAQVWYATRTSIILAVSVSFGQIVVGVIIGLIWGYVRKLDSFFFNLYNLINNVPTIIYMTLIALMLGKSTFIMGATMIAFGWLIPARNVRNLVFMYRDREYNLASRCLGTSVWRILSKNIFPYLVSVIILRLALAIPGTIAYETTLTYLGLMDISTPSLGILLRNARSYFLDFPYLLIFPAAIVSIITVTFYLVGNAFSDACDPRNHV
ncbi:MAG: ABC transporter permease [Clostridia bacterium]|nr:ABC transporter permease [Clostridia bacterium]